jgi:hypothetical protein
VTFSNGTLSGYPKNKISFEINSGTIYFTIDGKKTSEKIENIQCNGEQLTIDNAKVLLSSVLFRNASGDGSNTGGEEQIRKIVQEELDGLNLPDGTITNLQIDDLS